jgi:hypothetical protein
LGTSFFNKEETRVKEVEFLNDSVSYLILYGMSCDTAMVNKHKKQFLAFLLASMGVTEAGNYFPVMNVPVYLTFVSLLRLCSYTDLCFIFPICFHLIDYLLDFLLLPFRKHQHLKHRPTQVL